MNLSLETVLRCLDILPLVRENQGIQLAELAQRSGIDEKTIVDQLIPTLMLCGAPPYMPHDYVSIWLEGDHVYVEFADHFRRPVTLLPVEITALHLALTSAARPGEHDPAVRRRIEQLREKIERALPPQQRVFLEESNRISLSDHPDQGSPILEQVRRAVAERRKIEIEYLSFGDSRIKTRVAHPHAILVRDGVTYLPCFDELRDHLVTFRLDRINQVRVLGDHFEPVDSFDVEKLAREGFSRPAEDDEFDVRLEARGSAARQLAETLDQRQWRWLDDERLEIRLATSRPRSVVRWSFRFGPDLVIVEPESLRELAREELAEIAGRHS
ncbi:MAG: WYL domain-containing protein [Planctomycetes bacterium]|nr:WYL domain-containing protein [Planctomycetota bacterium]